jgi:membrane-associated phospholipid phosphatase
MRRIALFASALLLPSVSAQAGTESLGTNIAIAMPVAAVGIAAYKRDWKGVVYLGLDTVATVGAAFALKQIIKERRPDGSDFKSFPSDTTALSAASSSFLWARYGWEYGLPATLVTGFVAFSRVDGDKHHWYDVAASEVLSIGFAALLTPRLRERGIRAGFSGVPGGGVVKLSYDF